MRDARGVSVKRRLTRPPVPPSRSPPQNPAYLEQARADALRATPASPRGDPGHCGYLHEASCTLRYPKICGCISPDLPRSPTVARQRWSVAAGDRGRGTTACHECAGYRTLYDSENLERKLSNGAIPTQTSNTYRLQIRCPTCRRRCQMARIVVAPRDTACASLDATGPTQHVEAPPARAP